MSFATAGGAPRGSGLNSSSSWCLRGERGGNTRSAAKGPMLAGSAIPVQVGCIISSTSAPQSLSAGTQAGSFYGEQRGQGVDGIGGSNRFRHFSRPPATFLPRLVLRFLAKRHCSIGFVVVILQTCFRANGRGIRRTDTDSGKGE